jgi:hypothetical protein
MRSRLYPIALLTILPVWLAATHQSYSQKRAQTSRFSLRQASRQLRRQAGEDRACSGSSRFRPRRAQFRCLRSRSCPHHSHSARHRRSAVHHADYGRNRHPAVDRVHVLSPDDRGVSAGRRVVHRGQGKHGSPARRARSGCADDRLRFERRSRHFRRRRSARICHAIAAAPHADAVSRNSCLACDSKSPRHA